MKRAAGVLLPVFSLPGEYGIGCLSKEAYDFVKYLKKAGQTYWQILPVGPTSYGDSPYQSFSTFAGNPYFISLEKLIDDGLLTKEECDAVDFGDDETDIAYGKLYEGRFDLLRLAFKRSRVWKKNSFRKFVKKQSFWLKDYAMFMAIKDDNDGRSFLEWPKKLAMHDKEALMEFVSSHKKEVLFYEYLQYEFFRQWEKFKKYANKHGIRIIGDIPIYVSADSSDVWANPDLFEMDAKRRPVAVAGCPPDAFAPEGQLWGNPLYDWKYHKKTGYKWWILRMKACRDLYDVIRIDHFRGFDQFYRIPYGEETAMNGKWVDGPGIGLFKAISKKLGELPIIAEDLGLITDSVRELVKDSGFPNMKVLQFAFDARDANSERQPNDYLPFMYDKNCVVYTGTHDNETIVGWLDSITEEEKEVCREYLNTTTDDPQVLARELVRLAVASTADYCIIPLQDYLGLDNSARINTPSTLGENWRWRLTKEQLTKRLRKDMKKLAQTYWR